jgi:hypothetical protein
MLIDRELEVAVDWPSAALMSLSLLVMTLALYAIYYSSRGVGSGSMAAVLHPLESASFTPGSRRSAGSIDGLLSWVPLAFLPRGSRPIVDHRRGKQNAETEVSQDVGEARLRDGRAIAAARSKGPRPLTWGAGVVLGEIGVDGGLQVSDRAEDAAADALPRHLEKKFSTALSQKAEVGVKWADGCYGVTRYQPTTDKIMRLNSQTGGRGRRRCGGRHHRRSERLIVARARKR